MLFFAVLLLFDLLLFDLLLFDLLLFSGTDGKEIRRLNLVSQSQTKGRGGGGEATTLKDLRRF